MGRLYGRPKCGRVMWRREGAETYDVWTPAEPTNPWQVDDTTAIRAFASALQR